jgi:hypothetical protein
MKENGKANLDLKLERKVANLTMTTLAFYSTVCVIYLLGER